MTDQKLLRPTANPKGIRKYIFDALQNKNVLSIHYTKDSGESSYRKIYPIIIHEINKKEYLEAYCTLRQSNRMFKLGNITKLQKYKKIFSGYYWPYLHIFQPGEVAKIVPKNKLKKKKEKSRILKKSKRAHKTRMSKVTLHKENNFLQKNGLWIVIGAILIFLIIQNI